MGTVNGWHEGGGRGFGAWGVRIQSEVALYGEMGKDLCLHLIQPLIQCLTTLTEKADPLLRSTLLGFPLNPGRMGGRINMFQFRIQQPP